MNRLLAGDLEYYNTVKILEEIKKRLKKTPNKLDRICDDIQKKYKLLDEEGAKLMLRKYSKEEVRQQGILVCIIDENNEKRVEIYKENWVGFVTYIDGKTDFKIARIPQRNSFG